MQEFTTWYELLGYLVATPQARQRLANQLQVSPVTVTRWVNHTSHPRPAMLSAIINAFPEYRQEFLFLFARDHLFLNQKEEEDASSQGEDTPPAEFYRHLLSVYRQLAPSLRSVTIQQLILNDAIEFLDPQQFGIACALLLCLPPRGGNPVRSLYVAEGKGTNPWPQDLRQTCCLFGIESLAGAVATAGRPLLVDREESSAAFVQSRWNQYEQSSFAAPIMRGSQVAGCLLVSSTRPGTFLASRQQRLVSYADLLILAIEEGMWHDCGRIDLQRMPSNEVQKPFFTSLPQQTIARLAQDSSCTYMTMRLRLMQEIEERLIQPKEMSRSTGFPHYEHR
jgi:hypothetical protein